MLTRWSARPDLEGRLDEGGITNLSLIFTEKLTARRGYCDTATESLDDRGRRSHGSEQ
jgi:hypothetical protein